MRPLLQCKDDSPMVGIVVTISPSLSLYKMVVFPAASSPTIRILISFLPNNLLKRLAKFPIFSHLQGDTKCQFVRSVIPKWKQRFCPRRSRFRLNCTVKNPTEFWSKGPLLPSSVFLIVSSVNDHKKHLCNFLLSLKWRIIFALQVHSGCECTSQVKQRPQQQRRLSRVSNELATENAEVNKNQYKALHLISCQRL